MPGLQTYFFGNYAALLNATDATVEVIRIIHTARDLKARDIKPSLDNTST